MRPLNPPRRPGPSRWGYRLRRAWARPWVKGFVKGYLPAILLALAGLGVVSTDRLRLAVAETAGALAERLAARPEFAVADVAVAGATPALGREIAALTQGLAGRSSLALDLAALRSEIEALAAVARAAVVFDPGGTLRITIERRDPVALWRNGAGALHLIDRQGVVIRPVSSRFAWPDMPLLLGAGAEDRVGEALAILAAAPDLVDRLRGLARVGERRWDIVLDREQRIALPETNALAALEQVIALDEAQDLLSRDVLRIDMRNPARPVLRLSEHALRELDRLRSLASGEDA